MKSIVTILSAAVATALCAIAQAQDSRVSIKIEPQPMRQALKDLGQQTGLSIVFREGENAWEKLKAPRVSGELSAREALQKMLENTQLRFRFVNPSTVLISGSESKAVGGDASGAEVASQMRFAAAAEPQNPPASTAGTSAEDVQELEVKAERERIKTNLDRTRTENDVQPYTIFDRQTIEVSGTATVEDFLKQYLTSNTVTFTQDIGLGVATSDITDATAIASTVDLRGLGADKTVVLVNGRRHGADGRNGQMDLNSIPVSAVERIEVLSTSASALYGASALGGVVNVILRRDYNGGNAQLRYERSKDASDSKGTGDLRYGWSMEGGKTRINVNGTWSEASPLLMADRADEFFQAVEHIRRNSPTFFVNSTSAWLGPMTNIVASSAAVTNLTFRSGTGAALAGTSLGARSTRIPAGFAASTTSALNQALLAERGLYHDGLPDSHQATGLRRQLAWAQSGQSAGITLERQMTSWLDLTADFRYSKTLSESMQPTPARMTLPAGVAGNPFNEAISVAFPIPVELAAEKTKHARFGSLGASIRLPRSWLGTVEHAYSSTADNSRQPSVTNVLTAGGLQGDVRLGVLNPFVDVTLYPLNFSAYLRPVATTNLVSSERHTSDIRASGPLMRLPWDRAPGLTVGAQHDIYTPTDNITQVQVLFGRERVSSAAFAELLVPLVRKGAAPLLYDLELQLAGRYDHYKQETGTTGYISTTVPTYTGPVAPDGQPFTDSATYSSSSRTAGFRYQPLRSVSLRASYSDAFVPPTPGQLAPSIPDPDDPDLATVTEGATQYTDVPVLTGGNPDLTPQSSTSLNAGIVWQPLGVLSGLRLSVDYYKTEQKDAITNVSPQLVVDNQAAFPGRITRDATGAITQIDARNANLFTRSNSGVDVKVGYEQSWGSDYVSIQGAHTTVLGIKTQYSVNQPELDAVGFPNQSDGGALEHRSNLLLGWRRKGFQLNWAAMRYGSYKLYGTAGSPTLIRNPGQAATLAAGYLIPQGSDTIPAQLIHDLTVGYSTRDAGVTGFFEGTTIRLSVRNLFDKVPPIDMYYRGGFYRNTQLGAMRMRNYTLTFQKEF